MNKPTTTWTPGRLEAVYRTLALVLLLWLAAWLALPWTSLHDAAFGYLRTAQDLDGNRSLWRSGVDWGLGRWSFLYAMVLMLLHPLANTVYVLRALSTVGYLALVLRLTIGLAERIRRAGLVTLTSAVLLLAVLVTPAAVFWLNDGTESAWTLLMTVGLVFATRRVARHGTSSAWPLAVWSCVCVALRSEMIFAALASSAILAAWSSNAASNGRHVSRRRVATPWRTPGFGGLCGLVILVVIRLIMQAGLPLHAVLHPFWWGGALASAGQSFLQAGSFGWGLLLLWLLTCYIVRPVTGRIQATHLANLIPVGMVVLLALRGQTVAFASELAWPLLYAILWNILELASAERDHAFAGAGIKKAARLGGVFVLLLLMALPFEGRTFVIASHERQKELTRFMGQPLGLIAGLRGVAADTGYLGYYTQSALCNPGRAMGNGVIPLDYGDRVEACVNAHPEYAFVNLPQAQDLAAHMDLSHWSICQSYGLPQITRHDQHFLIAAPDAAERVCAASHGMAVPLASILPEYAGLDTP